MNIKLPVPVVVAFLLYVSVVPAAAASSDRFVAISCGLASVMALGEDGTVWTWGRVGWTYDENGSGDWYDQTTPVQVSIEDVTAISSGAEHSVVLKSDGTVWAWGYNYKGVLGDGTGKSEPLTPAQVIGLDNVVAISAGNGYTIALKNDGTVRAWGLNYNGQLGDGTLEDRPTPVMVKGLTDVIAIKGAALAIKEDGTVWSWRHGLLGADESTQSDMALFREQYPIPFQVLDLKNVKDIDTDIRNTAYVKEDGTVWNWGHSGVGSLGDGTMIELHAPFVTTPVQAQGLTNVKSALSTSMALKDDGTVWVWGGNVHGRHGDGKPYYDTKAVPVQVPGLSDVVAIDSRDGNTVFLKEDGSVWTCGSNSCGQIGDGTKSDWQLPPPDCFKEDKHTPVKVLGPETATPTAQAQNGTPSQDASGSPGPSQSSGFGMSTIITLIGLALAGSLTCSVIRKK